MALEVCAVQTALVALSQKLALLCIDIECLATGASGRMALAEAVAHLSERAGDIAGDVHRLSHDLHTT